MINQKVREAIERLEALPKQGESYDQKGRHGWRNPIRADTGPLLQALVFAKRPVRVLEIGTAHGLSGLYIVSALPLNSTLTTIEWDEETAKGAQKTFDECNLIVRETVADEVEKYPQVKVICGDAMQVIDGLAGWFDFVFMDANKDGYYEQIQKLLKRGLVKGGCLVVADNTIDRASEMGNFLDFARSYDAVTIPTECGLTVFKL